MDESAINLIHKYYSEYEIIDDIINLKKDVCKITICNGSGTEEFTYPHLLDYLEDYKIVVSGFNWLDISKINVNKGNGVKHIRELLNIENEDTVIFGDYLNDIEMFEVSTNAFAVANANPKILELATRIIESNEEDGVTNTIKEIIAQKERL